MRQGASPRVAACGPTLRLVRVFAAGNLVEGHVASSPPVPLGSGGTADAGGSQSGPRIVEGQPATAVSGAGQALESLDDMAAFVERTRVEEETIRRKREEVELQLLRMRQQEAVRRQQAIRMRVATEQANAAVLRGQAAAAPPPPQQHQGGALPLPSPSALASVPASAAGAAAPVAAGHDGTAADEGSSGGIASVAGGDSDVGPLTAGPGGLPGPGAGPPKKKLVFKRSKRMSAVAAASGLHRVTTPTGPAPGSLGSGATVGPGSAAPSRPLEAGGAPRGLSPTTGAASSSSTSSLSTGVHGSTGAGRAQGAGGSGGGVGNGGGGVALLSREEIIKNSREGREGCGGAGQSGSGSDSECGLDELVLVPKPIFIISDCTGESAARTVRAALNQFEMRCRTQAPAQIMIFRFVESVDKVMGIIQEAAKEDALVVYTLVDPQMVKAVQTGCKLAGVRFVDLWTTLLDTMEVHLHAVRSGVPASLAETRKRKVSFNDEYFRMIEAVEYTRKMDDGAHPQEWGAADLVILGVSRCGKTPLSIYLGQRGYKVANLPLIPGCPVPRELFEIDQTRIVGLIIDPHVLASIRRNRVSMMGVARAQSIDYAEVQKINSELEWARKLYNAHPDWPVLDVTLRGIEETAARILKLLNDRRGDASPKWVEAYHARQAAAAADAAGAEGAGTGARAQVRGPLGPSTGSAAPGYGIPELIYGANESTFLMQGLY